MGLFSKNQNSHGLIGKNSRMYDICCDEERVDCCQPGEGDQRGIIRICDCITANFLQQEGSPVSLPIGIQEVFPVSEPVGGVELYLAIENQGSCPLVVGNVDIDIQYSEGAMLTPIVITQIATVVEPGTTNQIFLIQIPENLDLGQYDITISYTSESCPGTTLTIEFSFLYEVI
jgi:hypothetical protein